MRKARFNGYTIYEDGTVIGLRGNEVKKHINKGRCEIKLRIKGQRKNFTVSRLIYYAFYPFDIHDRNMCVSFKDGDISNIHLDNLFLVKGENLKRGRRQTIL